MVTTEPGVKPTTARSSKQTPPSSSSVHQTPPPVGRDCQKCLTYLTRALDKVGSRPQSLLRALGVISHAGTTTNNNNDNERKIYERTENGRGILISLQNSSTPNANAKAAAVDGLVSGSGQVAVKVKDDSNTNNDSLVQGTKLPSPLDRGDNNMNNNTNEQLKSTDNNVGNIPLARRITILADGIRHSTEEILKNGALPTTGTSDDRGGGGVLTTSPAMESSPKDNVTTIAVECQRCGSDTRAEAGARAFVRGPEPLSIVLCSNRLSSQREVDEVLVHELVHIYDVHSRKMDLRDCRQLAWSEVRAAREAECSNSLTSFTANICAKDKATVATRNMFPDEGRKCVCDVFNEAMNDLAPFDGKENSAFVKASCAKGNNGKQPSPPATNHHTSFSSPDQSSHPFASPRWSDR